MPGGSVPAKKRKTTSTRSCKPWGQLGDISRIELNRLEHVTTPVNTEGGSWVWWGTHTMLPCHRDATDTATSAGPGPALTLHITHAVLADHPGVILLICRPLVDEHGGVGGPSIQHDAVLQGGKAVCQAWRLNVPWLLQPLPREGTGPPCTTIPTLSVSSSSGASSGRGRLCSAQLGTAGPTPAQTGHCLEM